VNEKISIGQGFRGCEGEGLGIGNCAKGFSHYIPGCPPKAVDIAKGLREYFE
jgi:Ni,Fe-hydrogenase III small subunit